MTTRGMLAGAVAALLLAAPAPAQEKADAVRTIVATGTGNAKVTADGARISFGVRTTGPTFALARDENVKLAKGLLESINGLKIEGVQVKASTPDVTAMETGQINGVMIAVPAGPGAAAPKKEYTHTYSQGYTLTMKDNNPEQLQKQAQKILETVLENGSNMVPGANTTSRIYYGPYGRGDNSARIDFFKEDEGEARRLALAKAVSSAKANAQALAQGLGVEIKEIVTVTDEVYGPSNNQVIFNPYGDSTASDSKVEFDLTVKVKLTCKF
jgi:uncharacterized protein YggE